jgi:hypothetical protein
MIEPMPARVGLQKHHALPLIRNEKAKSFKKFHLDENIFVGPAKWAQIRSLENF